ncbi:MAG: hypothetical protein ABI333_08565, partial [bacterium]
MRRTALLGWMVLLVGLVELVGSGCGKSSGNGNDDAGTGGDGSVGDDGGFTSPVLDPDFGDNGILRAQSTWSLDEIHAAALTADGDLLVGGTTVGLGHRSQPLLARFTSDGAPDPTFGNAGFVLLPLLDNAVVTGIAALPEGGAVLAGWGFFNANLAFAIRVDGQGRLDPTFGDGGVVTWDSTSRHLAVAVDSSGGVLLLQDSAGNAEVHRLTPAGVLDAAFGSGGIASVSGEDPRDLVVLADDRILTLTHENGTSWLLRLTASGDADSTFSTSGSTMADLEAYDLAVHPTTGALLVAGNGPSGGQVLQLDADGAPVTSFGTDGVADATAQEQLLHVEWLPSGDILALDARLGTFPSGRYEGLIRLGADGSPLPFDTTTADQISNANVAALLVSSTGMYLVGNERVSLDTPAGADIEVTLLGMNHDGTPLAGFGQSGVARAGSHGASEVVWDMGVFSDGALLVAGSAGVDPILMRFQSGAHDTTYGTNGFASGYHSQLSHVAIDDADRIVAVTWVATVVRFLPDGTVDTSFGTNGHITTVPGQARNVTIDAQQRIVVVGWEATGTEYPLIARYGSDGNPDTSFGNAGVVLGFDDATSGFAAAVHVDPDGRIIVTGERFPPMMFPELYIARLNDDG